MSARAAPASMTTRHKSAHRIADRVLFNFLLSLYGRSRLNRNANRRPRCGDRSGAILQEALSAASGSAVAYSTEAAGTAIAVKVSAAVTAAKVREGETRRGIDGGFGGVTRHVRLRRRVLCRSYRRKSAVRETPRGIDGVGFGDVTRRVRFHRRHGLRRSRRPYSRRAKVSAAVSSAKVR